MLERGRSVIFVNWSWDAIDLLFRNFCGNTYLMPSAGFIPGIGVAIPVSFPKPLEKYIVLSFVSRIWYPDISMGLVGDKNSSTLPIFDIYEWKHFKTLRYV